MASSSKSSPSSHTDVPVTKYDLFISFRGAEIRDNFLSHLLKEFQRKQIDVYVDERLQRGDEISPALLQAIKESSISLVIFSEDYAPSKWCMEELVKIIECKEQHRRIVIPVFYKIDPSHVRHQRGPFEEAFGKHQERYKENMVMVKSWRSALKTAADLSGFHYPSENYKNESELNEKIAKDVSNKLGLIFSSETNARLIGIDKNIESIESSLAVELRGEVRMVGIWGMGGIGKTTVAEAVFDKYSSQYEGCCFLRDVREESEKHGLHHLFRELACELLQDENILLMGRVSTQQKKYIKRRLSRTKAFIVLDDVSSTQQLEVLIGEQEVWLGPGSRVIVTTRDKQILTGNPLVHGVYKVQGLNFENSLQLFCLKAFNKTRPETGYEKYSERAVHYANGIPLAVKVLGSSLCSTSTTEVWESALCRLELQLDKDIFNVLKLSYDGLHDLEKKIFLDIAFFFKGQDKDYVTRLLDSCGFHAAIGIENLVRKAQISISKDNKIEMHDLIQQMGWKIVSEGRPENCSRLRNPKDVHDVLKYNKGTDLIEGIMWDLSQTKDLHLHFDTFIKMPKLRILIAYGMPSNINIPPKLETFSDELRYLEWMRYPLRSLPSSFCAEKLVEFSMPFSEVSKLWDGVQDLVNLEKINLWGCRQLEELPDFSKASKLREIDLTYCQSLRRVHPSILRTPTLEVLKLEYCTKLKSLESEFQFEHLHELDVGGCSSLEEFSVMSEKIRSLDLRGSKIEVLNSSIFYLDELERFYLSSSRIKRLPDVLCFLKSLVELDLSGCTEMIELPDNIKDLTGLTTLRIRDCCRLESLLELPSSITRLDATNCTSLKTVSGAKAVSSFKWTWFSLQNCTNLDEPSRHLVKEAVRDTMRRHAATNLRSMVASDDVSGICYPGSTVPEWFTHRTRGASVSIELDQLEDRLLGFFLCCVTSPLPYIFKDFYEIKSQCYLGDSETGGFEITWRCVGVNQGLNSGHVYTWFDNDNNDKQILLDEIKRYRTNDHCTTHSQKISLEFVIISRDGNDEENVITLSDAVIKETGVYPIYSQDIRGESELIDVTKGLVGIDEHIECIESLLVDQSGEVQSLGICGMSGIGKTTIAKVIFYKWSSQYKHCCFLENVTGESLKHGLPYLSRKLVSELLQGGKNHSGRQLPTLQKVFIVLDNVNSSRQLERLIEGISLGPGSRLIVTSRDKSTILSCELVHGRYEVQGLNRENSLELFCLNAFSKPHPKTRYALESEMAVSYAKGVPLVLKALGSFLGSRDLKAWGSELRKLELHPYTDISDVLKLCYDGLDDSERNIFLDIAFFFKGRKKDDVISLLDFGFHATSGIDSLICKALIYISEHNTIEMHGLIQQIGWVIVHQESIEDPGKRSRLRNHMDVYDVLKNNRGTDSIEGIMLDLTDHTRRQQIHLHADTFKRMPKLRILQIVDNYPHRPRPIIEVYNAGELQSFSNELRYLEWKRCPLRSLPSSFCAEKLVELRMPWSFQLTKLWDGVQDLVNLEIIDLHYCTQLVELPDFTKASKLREIHLGSCSSLCRVHPSILCIPTLEVLRLAFCKKMESFVGQIHFEYLHDLQVTGSKSLREFSVTSKKIRSLDLGGTEIDVLHSSIGCLSKLETFHLRNLSIKCLPDELCLLTSLVELDLSGCSEIIELPGNIKALTRLSTLLIRNCRRLQNLPELPSSVARLDAEDCTSLQTVRSIRAVSSFNWRMFSFRNCLRLLDSHSVNDLMEAAHDTVMRHAIDDCLNLLETYIPKGLKHDGECDVCYPGSEVPKWFRYQTRKTSSINLEFDQHGGQLLGFLLCCVISPDALSAEYYDKVYYIDIDWRRYLGNAKRDRYEIKLRIFRKDGEPNSDSVLIWCGHENKLLNVINQYRANNLRITNSQTISLEFVIRVRSEWTNQVFTDQVVKGWGISPIYVSDIHNFIGKKDKEMGFDDKYKEYRQLVLSKLNQLGR